MNDRPTTTLDQVARAAGVSPSTVSRILNGTARVSEAKRRSVEEAIAALDYRPNVLAQGLARGRSLTIGVLTQDIASPFYSESLKGIEEALAGTGYAPLFVSGHWDAEEEARKVALLVDRRVDGVIVLTGMIPDDALIATAERVPVAVTGRTLNAPRLIAIDLDHEAGAYAATRYLIDLGHTRIVHLAGVQGHADARARLAGYRRALAEAGIAEDPALIVDGQFNENGGLDAVNALLDHRVSFTAIFAANDQSAVGARLALYRRGLRVPDDVSLVGFDDLPGSLYTTPPLTTVRQPAYELGRLTARVLLHLIDNRPLPALDLPMSLIVRDSAGEPA
ncbi:LacI family DNA-binding transcriptional regulator [Chitiniphilus eburneus]|uniref:LacI family DNA-binding transcriptional regulator n=1 Tax=Chitiniphilus eburneus TaxID=2571148 RepID=A0A4U0P9E7_9NEIS|nr:substrate-binding domain-containing protein [Chitiniphilus eburneus]TJZ64050.1 LacI family DNA-binding transcriptional regulator [Chitiniphilus eburneus]